MEIGLCLALFTQFGSGDVCMRLLDAYVSVMQHCAIKEWPEWANGQDIRLQDGTSIAKDDWRGLLLYYYRDLPLAGR